MYILLIAVISDVHSNLAALEVVIDYINKNNVELVLNLGDLVGYYCKPNEVVALLTEQHIMSIMGNHDTSICGGVYEKYFSPDFLASLTEGFIAVDKNYDALEAIGWHLSNMDRKITNFLLQDTNRIIEIDGLKMSLAHGMHPEIRDNVQDAVGFYLYENLIPEYKDRILDHLESNNCSIMLTGHTHFSYHVELERKGKKFHLINPGSVGQPRDGDPRLSFSIIDISNGKFNGVENLRLEYNMDLTIELIKRNELPITLANRLQVGK